MNVSVMAHPRDYRHLRNGEREAKQQQTKNVLPACTALWDTRYSYSGDQSRTMALRRDCHGIKVRPSGLFDESVCGSVCLSVCLSVCPRGYLRNNICAIFAKFLCMLPVSIARSFSGMFTIGRIACRREGVFFPH